MGTSDTFGRLEPFFHDMEEARMEAQKTNPNYDRIRALVAPAIAATGIVRAHVSHEQLKRRIGAQPKKLT